MSAWKRLGSSALAVWLVLAAAGCASTTENGDGDDLPRRLPDVVVTGEDEDDREVDERRGKVRGPRKLRGVPPGHFPPPGECRLWYEGRPPGQQPPPTSCSRLRGIRVPHNAFILYGDRAYDTRYDWEREERVRPGSVPDIILDLMRSLRSP